MFISGLQKFVEIVSMMIVMVKQMKDVSRILIMMVTVILLFRVIAMIITQLFIRELLKYVVITSMTTVTDLQMKIACPYYQSLVQELILSRKVMQEQQALKWK